ncbi:MAG: DUF4388 domain-containing protein [Acidobacteriota bacterium]
MELTGHLSDFPLTDILQILSLSCKTGTLILRGEKGHRGMLVFIRGKIVQATTDSTIYSLGEILVQEGIITEKGLEEVLSLQTQMSKPRLLGSILVEKGVVGRDYLLRAIKQQIQNSINEMLSWRRGNFEIKLNAIPIGRGIPYITQDYVYTEGLNIEELLLEATKIIDESRGEGQHGAIDTHTEAQHAPNQDNTVNMLLDLDDYLEPAHVSDDLDSITSAESAMLHLKYLLEELKQHSFQGEISLLIMRLASEVCSRGVLFLVKEKDITGLGQFGLSTNGISPDQWVRGITIPLGHPSILDRIVTTHKTQISAIDPSTYDLEIVKRIGGEDLNLTAFGIPMIIEGKVRVILYGDNYPGDRGIGSLDELEILISQAGLMMEKLLLEKRLQELKGK